jgi:hypothetical protein
MQDRPTADELLGAVAGFLEREILPDVEGTHQFHTRVAIAALQIVQRELALEERQLAAEVAGLEALLGPPEATDAAPSPADRRRLVAERTEALCDAIRRGDADAGPFRDRALAHIRATVRAKLEVTNPRWLASASPPFASGPARR